MAFPFSDELGAYRKKKFFYITKNVLIFKKKNRMLHFLQTLYKKHCQYIYMYVCVYIYICVCVCVYMCMYVCVCILCVYVCVCWCLCVCIYVCVCLFDVCVFVCMCLCMYVCVNISNLYICVCNMKEENRLLLTFFVCDIEKMTKKIFFNKHLTHQRKKTLLATFDKNLATATYYSWNLLLNFGNLSDFWQFVRFLVICQILGNSSDFW